MVCNARKTNKQKKTFIFNIIPTIFTHVLYKICDLFVHIPRAQNNTGCVIACVTEL